jgi:hypothetical protein
MKRLFLFALIALSFGSYAQVENEEELDPEYVEYSEDDDSPREWKFHLDPASYKGAIYFEPYDSTHMAVMGDDMVLFLEVVSHDVRIAVEGRDFYVVFDGRNGIASVKGKDGKMISRISVPDGFDIEDSINMTEDEAYYRPYAFEIRDPEKGESRFYDKRCVLLDTRVF